MARALAHWAVVQHMFSAAPAPRTLQRRMRSLDPRDIETLVSIRGMVSAREMEGATAASEANGPS